MQVRAIFLFLHVLFLMMSMANSCLLSDIAELVVQKTSFTATNVVSSCVFMLDEKAYWNICYFILKQQFTGPGLGCCYSREMKDFHRCVERAMHHNCPVCFEVNPLHFSISPLCSKSEY